MFEIMAENFLSLVKTKKPKIHKSQKILSAQCYFFNVNKTKNQLDQGISLSNFSKLVIQIKNLK